MYTYVTRPPAAPSAASMRSRRAAPWVNFVHSIPVAIPPRWWRWRWAHSLIGQFISPSGCLYRNVMQLVPGLINSNNNHNTISVVLITISDNNNEWCNSKHK